MFLIAGLLCESLEAGLELAGIGSLSRVGPDMVIEVTCCREAHGALSVGTHIWPFPRVDPSVHVEML